MESGASEDDVIDRLRTRCVPSGYIPHVWNSGKYQNQKVNHIVNVDLHFRKNH